MAAYELTREQQARVDLLCSANDGAPICVLPIIEEDGEAVAVAQTGWCWHIDADGAVVVAMDWHGHAVDWVSLDEDEGSAYLERVAAAARQNLNEEG